MIRSELLEKIRSKKSLVCVGLDTDIARIPKHLLEQEDPVFAFNKAIIDATHEKCLGFKMNIAFYEALGMYGMMSLKKTLDYIPEGCFKIADAKRGDIGNTSKMYAQAFFKEFECDAITVAPYMGEDSVKPFLNYKGKWVILLARTSNVGSADFQLQENSNGEMLYERVIKKAQEWGTENNLMFVCGATHPQDFKKLRSIAPKHFFLVPGIGAQGGDLDAVLKNGLIKEDHGLIINSSRGIIYAGDGEDFAQRALDALQALNGQILTHIS